MKRNFACIIAILVIATAFVACNNQLSQNQSSENSTLTDQIQDNTSSTAITTTPEVENLVSIMPSSTNPVEKHVRSLVEVVENETFATCEVEGGYDLIVKCILCNDIISNTHVVIAAKGHFEIVDRAVEATCLTTGLTEGSHCSVCNKTLREQTIVSATGHTSVTVNGYDETCMTDGRTRGEFCSVCNETLLAQEIIPAIGHVIAINEEIPATCVDTGLTYGEYCTVCNEVLVQRNILPALGHTSTIVVGENATCTTDGKTNGAYCANCNTVLVHQETIQATGHIAGNIVKENIHISGSYESVVYCTICNAEMLRTKFGPTKFVDPSNNAYYHIDESIYTESELEVIKWIAEQLPILESSDVKLESTIVLKETLSNIEFYRMYQKISSIFFIIYGEEDACDKVMDAVSSFDKNGNRVQSFRLNWKYIREFAIIRDANLTQIDAVLKTIPEGTEEEILYDISMYISDLIVYTKGYYDVDDALAGRCVCNGYALLFNTMANRAGITTDLCVGYVDGWHAWNRVTLIDGTYRFYDITFYDGKCVRPKYLNSKDGWNREYIINDYTECWNGQ